MTSKAPATHWLGSGAPAAKPGAAMPMKGSLPVASSGGDTNPKTHWLGAGAPVGGSSKGQPSRSQTSTKGATGGPKMTTSPKPIPPPAMGLSGKTPRMR